MSKKTLSVWRFDRAANSSSLSALTDRAQAFGRDIASKRGRSMIMIIRGRSGLSFYVGVPTRGAEQSVKALADAVGAKPIRVDGFPEVEPGVLAVAQATGNTPAGRDRQETETTIISERMAATLTEPGAWVAVTMRRAVGVELRRERLWIQNFYGQGVTSTHHAMSAGAMVISMYAGCSDPSVPVSALNQIAGVMPGFDINVKVKKVSRLKSSLKVLAAIIPVMLLSRLAGLAFDSDASRWTMFSGGLVALISAGVLIGALPSFPARIERALRNGRALPKPRKRFNPPTKPKQDEGDNSMSSRSGRYPLHRASFLVGAHIPAMFASPHTGSGAGARTNIEKEPPPELVERCGPLIGQSAGLPVHLSLDDVYGARVFIGAPSSGKSILVRLLWGYDILERIRPSGLSGSVGANNSMVAFESKGEGALAYLNWANQLGQQAILIDLGNPNTYALDLFAGPDRVSDRASLFVNAMRYGFGESSIQDRSTAVLQAVFTAAQVVTPEIATEAHVHPGSPIWYAHVLLGAHGDDAAKRLAAIIERHAIDEEKRLQSRELPTQSSVPDDPFAVVEEEPQDDLLSNPHTDVGVAASKIGKFFTMSPSARANEFAAARNKVDQLVEAESWFNPDRPRLTWEQVINSHQIVIVNTGAPTPGPNIEQVGQKMTETMGAMLLFTLREAIARNCVGWYDQGRAVSIYADELSQVAATGPEVVEWLREQARSRGVRLTFATQRPEQLNDRLRACVLGFSTVGWMKTTNPQVIRFASDDLSIADDDWSPATVSSIPNYHIAIRTGREGKRLPPAMVQVGYYEDEGGMQRFVDDQLGVVR